MPGGVTLHIDVRNLVSPVLLNLMMRCRNLRPFFAQVANLLDASVTKTFQTVGRGTWPPLSEWTKKQRKGESYTILYDTGVLKRSIGILRLTPFELTYGTLLDYAPTHQWGRPPLPTIANIPEHTRMITRVYGRSIAPKTVRVEAHTRRMILPRIPQRMFLLFWPEDVANINRMFNLFLFAGRFI